MVEILKGETSNSYVEPGILPKKSITETANYTVIAGRNEGVVAQSADFLNINLFFYIFSALLAFSLFLPQARRFFSDIGWRWAHILCLFRFLPGSQKS
jgi:hypothetical protein